MRASKPIKVFWTKENFDHAKILIILEELGLPYESNFVEIMVVKQEPWVDADPNGIVPGNMAPVIIDPNNKDPEFNEDFKLSESGAIVSYLINTYDEYHRLTYTSWPNDIRLQQWCYYQATDQHPYFALAAGFDVSRTELLPNVSKHFVKQAGSIIIAIDFHLEGSEWLVGNKCTFADLSFVIWNSQIPLFEKHMPKEWSEKKLECFKQWQETMMQRKSVKTVLGLMGIENVKSDGKS